VLSRQAPFRRRAAGSAARSLSAVALAALLALGAGGCGGDEEETDAGGAGDGPVTSLEVALDVDGSTGGGEPQTAEVECPGDDACKALEDVSATDFEPVGPNEACTEIFGGPETATIAGTLDGEDVEATFNRANGCEIDRFGTFVPLLRALFPDYEPGGELQQP
jgi:hypothetical protein